MGLLLGFYQGLLDQWFGVRRLLWDNAFLAEDVVPVVFSQSGGHFIQVLHVVETYHSVSSLGLTSTCMMLVLSFVLFYAAPSNVVTPPV